MSALSFQPATPAPPAILALSAPPNSPAPS